MRETDHAPGELELVREFVNTLDIEEQTDELAGAEPAADWLRRSRLGSAAPTGAELERLVAIREALREVLLCHNSGDPVSRSALRTLNERVAGATLSLTFEPGGVALVPAGGGIDAVIARLGAVIETAIAEGTWQRLKVCQAEDCRWAFYDRSRNRSATWCLMGECGNRNKARAFRARRRRGS